MMGCYKLDGTITPVLFDLVHVSHLAPPKSDDWIARAMNTLFEISQESHSKEEGESDSIRVDLWPGKDELGDALRDIKISAEAADGESQTPSTPPSNAV